jgi:hypothetical protein
MTEVAPNNSSAFRFTVVAWQPVRVAWRSAERVGEHPLVAQACLDAS